MPHAPFLLRDELLRDTVEWCRTRSTFYGKRFADLGEFRGLADLARLPVLFRQDIVDNIDDFPCVDSVPAAVQYTTGTTGTSLHVHRSPEELAFIWNFFSAQLEATPPPPGPTPLHLNLINAYHGGLTGMPSRSFVLSAGVYDKPQAEQVRDILGRTFTFPGVEPRVSAIMGTERMVKAVTAYLIADGYDLAASPVRLVMIFGGHVTPGRKRLLGHLWGAYVQDNYSLTEMFGGATECGIGGPWVFEPHVIPEVVHPRTLEPVTEGIGALLLTGLYPFVQAMPLVRYFTGDLVEVVAGPDSPAGLQVRYKGRVPRSIVDASGPEVVPLLLSGPLYEALERLPDIAITPRFPDLDAGLGLELTGDHHYAVDHTPADGGAPETITIRLGLRYSPWMFPDRVREVVTGLANEMFREHPALHDRFERDDIAFRIEPHPAEAVPIYDSK